MSFLEKSIPKKELFKFLQEDYVGIPTLINSLYLTSPNGIHHLYHLVKFQEKTKTNFDEMNTIIEWGGGYGNMAKLLKRMVPKVTYIIIDLPLMSCLQWIYLATIFGETSINLLDNINKKIKKGKINLLPVCFLRYYDLNADIFIATWSLNESSKYAQDYVGSLNFFNAKHLLLAYHKISQKLPDSGRIGEIAKVHGAVIIPIEFLPGHYYALK